MTPAAASQRPRARTSLVDRVFRNPDTGEVVLWQAPNPPLVVFLLATGTRTVLRPDGAPGTAVSVVSGLALAWWSVDEIARGDSLFRRMLGGAVLAGAIARRLL